MKFGDKAVPGTPSAYGDAAFDGLLEHLRPRIESYTGHRLLPTYSYFRMYKNGDVLKPHRDRPACEISVSLNIGHIAPDAWPFCLRSPSGKEEVTLSPGDGVLYRGMDILHWRDPFKGKVMVQAFLHYVDANGPHADKCFDGRQSLMRPKKSSI